MEGEEDEIRDTDFTTNGFVLQPVQDDAIDSRFQKKKIQDIAGLVIFLALVIFTIVYGVLNLREDDGLTHTTRDDYSEALKFFLFSIAVAEVLCIILAGVMLLMPHISLWVTGLIMLGSLPWLGFLLVLVEKLWWCAIIIWVLTVVLLVWTLIVSRSFRITKEILYSVTNILKEIFALVCYSFIFGIVYVLWCCVWLTVAAAWHWGPNPREGVKVPETQLWEYIIFSVIFILIASTFPVLMHAVSSRMVGMWFYEQQQLLDCCGHVGKASSFIVFRHLGSCFFAAPVRHLFWWSRAGFTVVYFGLYNCSMRSAVKRANNDLKGMSPIYHVNVFEMWFFWQSCYVAIAGGLAAGLFQSDEDWGYFSVIFSTIASWFLARLNFSVWLGTIRACWCTFFEHPQRMLYKETLLHNTMLACVAHYYTQHGEQPPDHCTNTTVFQYLQEVGDPRIDNEGQDEAVDLSFPVDVGVYIQKQKDRDKEWKQWKQHVDGTLKLSKVHLVNLDRIMEGRYEEWGQQGASTPQTDENGYPVDGGYHYSSHIQHRYGLKDPETTDIPTSQWIERQLQSSSLRPELPRPPPTTTIQPNHITHNPFTGVQLEGLPSPDESDSESTTPKLVVTSPTLL